MQKPNDREDEIQRRLEVSEQEVRSERQHSRQLSALALALQRRADTMDRALAEMRDAINRLQTDLYLARSDQERSALLADHLRFELARTSKRESDK